MTCFWCQEENPPGSNFCLGCGARLSLTCSSCRTELPAGSRFCNKCGAPVTGEPAAAPRKSSPESYTPKHLAERILSSKASLEGERKRVTVLFADLKGSMELLADRDPEEARKILDPVLELMMEAVHRYEGTVNQVMGDGIMALFGAPLAHEDHAVRACYAALRMQESVGRYAETARREHDVTVHIRVGLNSGEVVVRAIGSDLHMDYTAVGQTTHLAARMEQLAEPGSILISPATMELAEGYVEVKPVGRLPVKGLPAPMDVYELVGVGPVRSRLRAAAARGLTPFVGRDSTMDQLRQALERAQAGSGQVVALVGEPGVGKSRLYWEFTHSHRAQGWLMLESDTVSYGKATAYLPVIDLLKGYFHIEGRDDTRTIREKVTGKVLSLDRGLEPSLSALLSLLDVPVEDEVWERLDPPQRRQRTLAAVKQLLLRESRVQPLLLIVEDLHWVDEETQTLLDSLVESLPTTRLLLLANYRPEYQHRWGSKTYYQQLRIDPLPAATADDLLTSVLGTEPSLDALKSTLIERTEGNPLFLEESVRTLAESKALIGERGAYRLARDVTTIQVPVSVQAILAARIDRLSPEDKRLLQAASVIGKDVPYGLLLAIGELTEADLRRGLAHLQAAEFLYETSLFPDLEYTFKHALTHEVTYGGLLQDRRSALHSRIVEAIETLYRDRLGEHTERLAHHALRGDLREKAVRYLRQAGNKSMGRSALQDARAWYEQALSVLDTLPESQSTLDQACEIHLELRPVLFQLAEVRTALEHLRNAEVLAERLNDDRRRGQVCAIMTNIHSLLGELDEACASGVRSLEIARRLGDLRLRILTTGFLEQAHYNRGDYARVVELATENLSVLPADWAYESFVGLSTPVSVVDRSWLVRSLAQLGRFAEAAEHADEMIRIADTTHQVHSVGLAYYTGGTRYLLQGDWGQARSKLEHGIAVIRKGNVVVLLRTAVPSSAWALAQLGEATEALSRLREGEQLLELQAAKGVTTGLGWAYPALGRAGLLLGRFDEARSLAERALDSTQGQPGFAAYAHHLLGDITTQPDRHDADSGEAHYQTALALAERRGMRPLIAHCHLGLGKLYRRIGKLREADEHLTTATMMYREMDMRFYLWQAEAELKGLG
jgi:class 3 adenylate cyclase/tetratricopeptide (TPR) repeat protein